MKLQPFRWIVVLLVLLTLPLAAGAQEYRGRAEAKGKVVNPEGAGLGDSIITAVYLETGDGPEAMEAEGDGEFEVEDLKPGMWAITAAAGHLGYGAETVEIEVLERDTPEFEITLLPLQQLLDDANTQYQAQSFAEARDLYMKIFTALPDNVNLHQPIALTYQAEDMHEQALEHFDLLLAGWQTQAADAGTPQDMVAATEIRLQAVSSAALMADYPRMHGYIDAIGDENLSSSAVSGLLQIGANLLLGEQKQYEEAVSVLDLVVSQDPAAPSPYYYRGMAQIQLEDDEAALADLQKFVELSPTETPQVEQAKGIIEQLAEASSPSL